LLHAIRVGWLAGLVVLLAGLPLPFALAAPVLAGAGAAAWARWGAGLWPGLKTAFQLKRLIKRAAKIGEAVERA
jgi:hypothetical protein